MNPQPSTKQQFVTAIVQAVVVVIVVIVGGWLAQVSPGLLIPYGIGSLYYSAAATDRLTRRWQ